MANQVKLSARPRVEVGRNALSKVRARGAIPAVLYGARDAATNLEIDKKDIQNLLSRAVGENILVDLEIREGATISNRTSLIQEVQHHPVRGEIIHVDFHAVSMTEEIDAEVVLEPEGEPVGVKTFGGLLQQSMRSLPIRCLPQNLPNIIVVDVSGLNIGESLHVRDIKLPPGVGGCSRRGPHGLHRLGTDRCRGGACGRCRGSRRPGSDQGKETGDRGSGGG